MSTLPARPTPPSSEPIDLRALDWFPLHHKRLRRSDWWLRATDQAKAINIELWCEAMEQVPAGSLPDNDAALAQAAGFGRREIDSWTRIKADVMEPWMLCNDGRWYHPTLVEVAADMWSRSNDKRLREREKKRAQRARDKEDVPGDEPEVSPGTKPVVPLMSPQDRTGQDITEQDSKRSLPSVETRANDEQPADPPEPVEGAEAEAPPAPKPAAKGKALAKAAEPRPHRLPVDWLPDDENRTYAADKGFTPEEVEDLIEDFVSYFRSGAAKKDTRTDWGLSWKRWVREDRKRRDSRGTGHGAGQGRGTGSAGDARRDRVADAMRGGFMEAVSRKRRS